MPVASALTVKKPAFTFSRTRPSLGHPNQRLPHRRGRGALGSSEFRLDCEPKMPARGRVDA
jgi:hypothetical protein